MRLALAETKYLKDSISIISDLVTEARFKVTKDSLELVAMDPANVAMVIFKLLSSSFTEYKLDKDIETVTDQFDKSSEAYAVALCCREVVDAVRTVIIPIVTVLFRDVDSIKTPLAIFNDIYERMEDESESESEF